MIAYGLRGLARLVALVVLLVLAILAGATAIGAAVAPDGLDRIASGLQGPEGRQEASDGLAKLEAPGPVATQGAIIGGAMLVGGLLVAIGCVVPARSKLVRMGADGDRARVSARPKALAAAGRALAEEAPGSGRVRVRASGRRRRPGGRLRVHARTSPGQPADAARAAVSERVASLADGFGLRARVSARASAEPRERPARKARVA